MEEAVASSRKKQEQVRMLLTEPVLVKSLHQVECVFNGTVHRGFNLDLVVSTDTSMGARSSITSTEARRVFSSYFILFLSSFQSLSSCAGH